MTTIDIVRHRLVNQCLTESPHRTAAEVVGWLGAVQAQEYAQARWAIGLRAPHLTDVAVEAAFDAGLILRTHVLRPTWHFVTPADLRWLLALTGSRVQAGNALMYRRLELDASTLARAQAALTVALAGQHLTRAEIRIALAQVGIEATGQRLAYLLMHAELEALICSGPRRGKQFTYALLDERAPAVPSLTREEALAALTRRYFASRAPATVADFTWWSGLTVKDVRVGLELVGNAFERAAIDGQEYVVPATLPAAAPPPTTFLMPDYDEYGISYRARGALFTPALVVGISPLKNGTMPHILVLDGVVGGTWQRPPTPKAKVAVRLFAPPDATQQRALEQAVAHYHRFVGWSDSANS